MQINVPLTVTAAAYSAGHSVGGKIAIPGLVSGPPLRVAITEVMLIDKASQVVLYDLFFHNADLIGVVTDHSTYNASAGDDGSLEGHLTLGDLVLRGSGSGLITLASIYKPIALLTTGAWAVLVTRGAPTYAGIADVTLRITAEQVYG